MRQPVALNGPNRPAESEWAQIVHHGNLIWDSITGKVASLFSDLAFS
jgi:hypothetical protein